MSIESNRFHPVVSGSLNGGGDRKTSGFGYVTLIMTQDFCSLVWWSCRRLSDVHRGTSPDAMEMKNRKCVLNSAIFFPFESEVMLNV